MGLSSSEKALAPSGRIRAFQRSRRWVRQVRNACDAVHQALWLGFLDADGLQGVTDHHYRSTRDGMTADQNYFSAAFNASGLFEWEQAAVDAHFAACTSVLIASAGGGREALVLARRNMKVDGFECNPDLLQFATSFLAGQGAAVTLLPARPNEVPGGLGTYDGAIVGWSAYMHIVGRGRRIKFLTDVRSRLTPGSPLLLSFMTYRDSAARRMIYQGSRIIRALRFASPAEPHDGLSTTYDHQFTESEIRQELDAAGFELVYYGERSCGHAVGRARTTGG